MKTKSFSRLSTCITLSLLGWCLAGCTSIPKNGAVLSAKVGEGIQRNQAETEKVIKALGDVERAILNQEWDNLYVKVEAGYLKKQGLGEEGLTAVHRRSIAANAAKVYYDLLGEITAKEAALIASSRQNSAVLIQMNDTVANYLLSVEKLDAARKSMLQKLGEVAGIDFNQLSGLANKLIANVK